MTATRAAITAAATPPHPGPTTKLKMSPTRPTIAKDKIVSPARVNAADIRSTRSLRCERKTARWIITGASSVTVETRASARITR